MKIIIMNKRKLQVFIILVILMMVLFGVGEALKGHLKSVSFMQNNIKALKSYQGLNGKLKYELPSKWTTSSKNFPGQQILYHNDFISNDNTISGFVQVWREDGNLKSFLDNSKKISEEQNKIKSYKIKNININNRDGYLVKYIMVAKDVDYVAYEYFLKTYKGFVRFSFFSTRKNFKEDMSVLYESIVKTMNLKEV